MSIYLFILIGLQFLEFIDLSFNQLKTVEELDFARLPRLRELILKENRLEVLSEMAFHNSSQLQIVDLSFNKLDRLGERTFEGFTRIVRIVILISIKNSQLKANSKLFLGKAESQSKFVDRAPRR